MEDAAAPEVSATPDAPASDVTTDDAPEPKLEALAKETEEKPKAPEKPQPKRYKLKVDGREEEVEEEEIIRRAQRASAADKRFQEAAEIQKKYQATVEKLKANPWELFQALNMDPHAAAEQLLIEKLKLETMTPAERRAYDIEQENQNLKSRLEMTEKEREEEKKAVEEQYFNELKSEAVTTIDQGIVKAIQEAGLKKPTPSLIRRVAQQMLAYHDTNGGKLLEPKTALKKVLDDLQSEWTEALDSLPEAEYETRLPKGFIENLRRHLISKVDTPASFSKQKSTDTTARPGKRVKSSTDEFFTMMDKRFG